MTSIAHPDLWSLVLNQPQFAPGDLAEALEREARRHRMDFRTRLLIRDSLDALRTAWGDEKFAEWLMQSPRGEAFTAIRGDGLRPAGFPSLIHRIMEATRTDVVLQFLRELGRSIQSPASISIGGSVALILTGLLSRRTEDIDVVGANCSANARKTKTTFACWRPDWTRRRSRGVCARTAEYFWVRTNCARKAKITGTSSRASRCRSLVLKAAR